MKKIRILVADDMESIRNYYKMLIDSTAEMECIGTASNEAEAIEKAGILKPDILLLDMQMDQKESGISVIPEILKISPETAIIILTVHDDKHTIFEAIRLGAKNYLIKTQSWEAICAAIIDTYNGNDNLNASIAAKLLNEIKLIETKQNSLLYLFSKFSSLSATEIEILRQIYNGKSTDEIAAERFVEPVTIRSNVSRILKKLQYKNAKTLVAHIKEMKLFELIDNAQRD